MTNSSTPFWEWFKNLFSEPATNSTTMIPPRSPSSDIEIIDRNDSPVPGWKHYYILSLAEAKIHEKLYDMRYGGRLIGLSITYGHPNPDEASDDRLLDPYTMRYGYVSNLADILEDQTDPLPDEFSEDLFDEVNDLIIQHGTVPMDDFVVELETTLNRDPAKNRIITWRVCRSGQCNRSNNECIGQWRKMTSRDGGRTWRCNHKARPH